MALLEAGDGTGFTLAQAAINAAQSGDTVRLLRKAATGNAYPEALVVDGKQIRLVGVEDPAYGGPVVSLPGAGAGVQPTLRVINNGGVHLENLLCSNARSAAPDVLRGQVGQDRFSRLIVDGGGSKICLVGQYVDNCLLKNGTTGLSPSCPGQVMADHVTVVNMSVAGLVGNPSNGDFRACLAALCSGNGFANSNPTMCWCNFSDDATAAGGGSKHNMTLAEISFVDLVGFLLAATSLAYQRGASRLPLELRGFRRERRSPQSRVYGGCYDPFPFTPVYAAGTSSIRVL